MLKTSIIGHLGQDAIVRHWNGKQAISFAVAYNETYKDKDGTKHERTTWVNCTLWRDNETTLASYLKKGQLVYAEGTPSVKTYISKSTGEVLPDFQLNVRQLQLLGSSTNRQDTEEQRAEEQKKQPAKKPVPAEEPSVPWEE